MPALRDERAPCLQDATQSHHEQADGLTGQTFDGRVTHEAGNALVAFVNRLPDRREVARDILTDVRDLLVESSDPDVQVADPPIQFLDGCASFQFGNRAAAIRRSRALVAIRPG